LSGNRRTDGHDRSPHLDTDAVNDERTTCRSTVIVAVASLGTRSPWTNIQVESSLPFSYPLPLPLPPSPYPPFPPSHPSLPLPISPYPFLPSLFTTLSSRFPPSCFLITARRSGERYSSRSRSGRRKSANLLKAGPILSVFPALVVHSELKSVHQWHLFLSTS